ncbi:MAG: branched-chain amino acid ABC transporter permease [Candidatus Nanoarchaeia archaeon]|nr:branched-chain amino acid ABC transporter permease [Candidatus Nanoarchaeia archaeon]
MLLPQLIVNGIIAGAIYALVAASFSLIFNILKFMDLSPGALFVIGAFATYAFNILFGMNFFISLLLGLIVVAICGVLINLIVYTPLRKRKADNFSLLLASFGVFLFLTGMILLIFGAEVKSFGFPIEKGYEILGIVITKLQIILIIVSLILFVALQLFMTKTKIGKALRAISDNPRIASTLGINTEKFTNITFIISSLLAGIAGILISLEQNLDHAMGFSVILKGITASVVGGIGSVPAALIGGFLIGIVENIGIWFLPSGFKDAIAFVILIIFLLIRPKGLFGVKTREEVSG